jgi:hypothetical protein
MSGPDALMFEVHYGGTFNRQGRCTYVGGSVSNYPDPVDGDKVSFLDIEDICANFGYNYGDLIYYKLPHLSLDQGLRLLSSDHDVLAMVSHHIGNGLVELYIVEYSVVDVDR